MSDRYALKADEAGARRRLEAFWAGESVDRPALLLWAAKTDYDAPVWPGPELTPYEKDLSVEWQRFRAQYRLESRYFLAEAMPGYTIEFGRWVPLLACLTGGRYEYREGESWIMPDPEVFLRPLPSFDAQLPLVERLTEIIKVVGADLKGRAILSQVPWMDAFTTLTSLRDPSELFVEMFTDPEPVKIWTAAATDVLNEGYAYFYEELCRAGQDETLSWLNLLAPGRMEPIQCDYAMMLSPEHFTEFVYPDLCRQAEQLDYVIYHLDGKEAMHYIDQIASLPKIRAIQYNTEPSDNTFPHTYLEDFRTIREKGLSLYLPCRNADEALFLTRELGPDGLLLSLPKFENRRDAERFIETLETVSRTR